MSSPFKPLPPRFETHSVRLAACCTSIPERQSAKAGAMADRPNTPVPTMADIENPVDGEQSSGVSEDAVDTAAAEEQAVALAASKLTRPTTRLANDVLLLIATRGTARDLGKAQVVSRGWQAAARREVTLRTAGRVLNVFSEKPAYLRSIEILDDVVGPRQEGSWRDRWPELQYAKFLRVDESLALLHDRETVLQLFRANIHVVDSAQITLLLLHAIERASRRWREGLI